jgi:hypothetical protein
MILAVGIVAKLIALAWAYRWSVSRLFNLWLLAHALSSPVNIAVYLIFGADSPLYFWTYTVATSLILAVACRITWKALQSRHYRARGMACGAILGLVGVGATYQGIALLGRSVTPYDLLAIWQGGVLWWAGSILGYIAAFSPRMERREVALILGLLWLGQGVFNFGYALHIDWAVWQFMDQWVQPLMLVVACGMIGWRLKPKRLLAATSRQVAAESAPTQPVAHRLP